MDIDLLKGNGQRSLRERGFGIAPILIAESPPYLRNDMGLLVPHGYAHTANFGNFRLNSISISNPTAQWPLYRARPLLWHKYGFNSEELFSTCVHSLCANLYP